MMRAFLTDGARSKPAHVAASILAAIPVAVIVDVLTCVLPPGAAVEATSALLRAFLRSGGPATTTPTTTISSLVSWTVELDLNSFWLCVHCAYVAMRIMTAASTHTLSMIQCCCD